MQLRNILISFFLLLGATSQAQSLVETNGKKYVLLENMTGAWCGYCTDGIAKVEWVLNDFPNTIAVCIHDDDDMEIAASQSFRDAWPIGYPKGTVDRTKFWVSNTTAMGRLFYYVTTKYRHNTDSVPSFDVKLSHVYDTATGIVDITITAKARKNLTGKYNVNVYIVEDSLTGTGFGFDQQNNDNGTVGHPFYNAGDPIIGFAHNHVVRAMLGGSWGTTGVISDNPQANAVFAKNYTYTIPDSFKLKDVKIVALVQKHNPASDTDRNVLNAIQAKLVVNSSITSVKTVHQNDVQVKVCPNPTKGVFTLDASNVPNGRTEIRIVNSVGQCSWKTERNINNNSLRETFDIAGLLPGYYFIELKGSLVHTVQRMVILP